MNTVYSWGHERRYNDASSAFRQHFAGRVQKVSVDGGFTCPNRDGKLARTGCAYCNNATFNPDYCREEGSIAAQLREGMVVFSRNRKSLPSVFLAYFQAYSNTYAPLEVLKARYEEALSVPGINGLVLGTRPDCVTPEILDYLAELSQRCYVMVEYGVESVKDETLRRINRGHSFAEARLAIGETAQRGIACGAHLMLGLPGEDRADWLEQARVISELPIDHLKLHQLQIVHGTQMANEYREHPERFPLFTPEEYLELVVDYLERLSPQIVVERFTSESPPALLIAPQWGELRNYQFTHRVEKRLRDRATWQGRLFQEVSPQA
ncbi:TIGR01212 family radical SAM protein [Ruficoccus amylovorans]|uniref:TIGR01212 family radical SAM protein n=1 Tax=Ruficoccus amylovorans TaxID=1804625 RepID=A0A842HBD6_9BACT|nr:TIGR01212 family radical SAM protein [Ruficoccus amylovorans]MBC2593732.1 TIGR01212 family radical SAM protein [Ruficoccus amylovorans]